MSLIVSFYCKQLQPTEAERDKSYQSCKHLPNSWDKGTIAVQMTWLTNITTEIMSNQNYTSVQPWTKGDKIPARLE